MTVWLRMRALTRVNSDLLAFQLKKLQGFQYSKVLGVIFVTELATKVEKGSMKS